MMDYGTLRLLHRHGDSGWGEMAQREHRPADHDVERKLLRGARIFRCDRCNEEIAVVEGGDHD